MKILLLTQDYPPVLNSAARLFSELAESLHNYGYNVSVITRIPERYLASNKDRRGYIFYTENKNGIYIYRVKSLPFVRDIPLIRAMDHLWTSVVFLLFGLFIGKHDIVIVYSPPLPLGLTGWVLAKLWKGKIIVNVQDIYPQTVIDLGLLKNRILIKIAEWLEIFVYKKTDAVIVHSYGNRDFIIKRGAIPEKIYVIENWIDLGDFSSGNENSEWSDLHGLNNRFIVSFAGTMGFAQGLREIIEVAEALKDYKDILFVLVGDGVLRPELEKIVQEKRLGNVKFIPHQPVDAYRKMLAASDICLVTLDKRLKTPVVPGKLQSIMAAGKPIICIANPASDAKKIIEEAGCGFFISPQNIEEIVKAIFELYKNKSLSEKMGLKGREYAEKFFDRNKNIQKYLNLLSSL